MRRYVLSIGLFCLSLAVLVGCDGLTGNDHDFTFYTLMTETKIWPAPDYRLYNIHVGFYFYEHGPDSPDDHPYSYVEFAECNSTELGKDVNGIFIGQVFPVNGEEFYFTAREEDSEANWGARLEKPYLTGISEGANIVVSSDYVVPYISEDGDGIQVWCEDDHGESVTAGEQDDDGSYEGLDTTDLSGPGQIRISRFYENRDIYFKAVHSAMLEEGEIVNVVDVTWVQP